MKPHLPFALVLAAGVSVLAGLAVRAGRGGTSPIADTPVAPAPAPASAPAQSNSILHSPPSVLPPVPAPDLGPWTRDPRVAVLLDPSADDTDRNEAAVALRQARYPAIADDLVRVLGDRNFKRTCSRL